MTELHNHVNVGEIESCIRHFLAERLQQKLDKLKEGEDEKRQELLKQYQPRNWIADAARRVAQIQRVTHAIKFSHPEARGSSLYSEGNFYAGDTLVGTHILRQPIIDVVGNAGSIDVYEFLRVEIAGTSLLELARDNSPALLTAFGGDDKAKDWIKAFATIDNPRGAIASHKLVKQVYWPTKSNGYHLLGPLFPSSLVQAQYEKLREDRFSDDAQAARKARFEKKGFDHGFREYPRLTAIRYGATSNARRNISWLNFKKRHGEAWLLASLPPTWKSTGLKPPSHVESIFGRWLLGFRSIREPIFALRDFLRKTAHNNLVIRNTRAALTRQITDAVLILASSVQELPPCWSANEDCRLNRDEVFWLDARRAGEDPEFALQRERVDWQENVAKRFGLWLNRQLDSDNAPMSNPERRHWQGIFENELRLLREELNHV